MREEHGGDATYETIPSFVEPAVLAAAELGSSVGQPEKRIRMGRTSVVVMKDADRICCCRASEQAVLCSDEVPDC
jgi:hypothetical protein